MRKVRGRQPRLHHRTNVLANTHVAHPRAFYHIYLLSYFHNHHRKLLSNGIECLIGKHITNVSISLVGDAMVRLQVRGDEDGAAAASQRPTRSLSEIPLCHSRRVD